MKVCRYALLSGFLLSSILIIGLAQGPTDKTRGQSIYHTQEAHDAVQDQRLEQLELLTRAQAAIVQETHDRVTWLMGGTAGFGALLTILHVIQLRMRR